MKESYSAPGLCKALSISAAKEPASLSIVHATIFLGASQGISAMAHYFKEMLVCSSGSQPGVILLSGNT